MRSKKTFSVGRYLCKINWRLSKGHFTQSQKHLMCEIIEGILLETGNYLGYGYDYNEQGDYRFYYVHPKIREDYKRAEEEGYG